MFRHAIAGGYKRLGSPDILAVKEANSPMGKPTVGKNILYTTKQLGPIYTTWLNHMISDTWQSDHLLKMSYDPSRQNPHLTPSQETLLLILSKVF